MIRNKSIILPFLFIAWTIIFAHSIIPHHHHNPSDFVNYCEYNHNQNDHIQQEEIHDCHHDCSGHACHFHVDVLTKLNIDNDFFVSFKFQTLYNVEISNFEKFICNQDFTTQLFLDTNFLRGPPQIV